MSARRRAKTETATGWMIESPGAHDDAPPVTLTLRKHLTAKKNLRASRLPLWTEFQAQDHRADDLYYCVLFDANDRLGAIPLFEADYRVPVILRG